MRVTVTIGCQGCSRVLLLNVSSTIDAYLQHFKAEPGLPNQVYAFDPSTGHVRVVADQLNKPNGLAFSNDFKTLYMYVATKKHPGRTLTRL